MSKVWDVITITIYKKWSLTTNGALYNLDPLNQHGYNFDVLALQGVQISNI